MNKYSLMKIVETAGQEGFRGRKRLQKVVFFAQRDGLPVDADFGLHRYGPYSHDLSQACSELTSLGLIEETTSKSATGIVEYGYELTSSGKDAIKFSEEQTPDLTSTIFSPQKDNISDLINENLWKLELGSTILFYYNKIEDWDIALSNACEFKNVKPDEPASIAALELAKKHAQN
tara:strand:- start:1598 stop:2125 length:528 start_codon:yes stop_codon:yes gene_type:complete